MNKMFFRSYACLACALGLSAALAHVDNLSKEPPVSPCAFIMPCDPALPLADEPARQQRPGPLLEREMAGGTASGSVTRVFSAIVPRNPERPFEYWPILLNGVPPAKT
jgi:hypothetical protein